MCMCMCICDGGISGHGGIVHMQYAEKVDEIESGKDHVVLMRDSFIVASSILHCICFSSHPIATNRTAPDSRTSGKTATATAISPNSALQVLQRPSCISTNSGEAAHSIPKMRSIPQDPADSKPLLAPHLPARLPVTSRYISSNLNNPNVIPREQSLSPTINTPVPISIDIFHF